ncbi:unnamed protein product [Prunus armeniaca]
MRTVKKDIPLPALGEPILVAKLQKIPRKRSPPTRRLGSATEKVDPHEPMRKSISIAQSVKAINMINQPYVQKALRSL